MDESFQRDIARYACFSAIDGIIDALKQSQMFRFSDEKAARANIAGVVLKTASTLITSHQAKGESIQRHITKMLVREMLDLLLKTPTQFVVTGVEVLNPSESLKDELAKKHAITALRNQVAYQIVDDVFDQAASDFDAFKSKIKQILDDANRPSKDGSPTPSAASPKTDSAPSSDGVIAIGIAGAFVVFLVGSMLDPGMRILAALATLVVVVIVGEKLGKFAAVLVILAILEKMGK